MLTIEMAAALFGALLIPGFVGWKWGMIERSIEIQMEESFK